MEKIPKYPHIKLTFKDTLIVSLEKSKKHKLYIKPSKALHQWKIYKVIGDRPVNDKNNPISILI